MDDESKKRQELSDGRAFQILISTTPLWMIACMANLTEAEVQRRIKLAEQEAAAK